MRFETSVLTREIGSSIYDAYVTPFGFCEYGGIACLHGMQRKPHYWDLADAYRIVLVFSTTPVLGAATCKVRALKYAGRNARERHPRTAQLLQRSTLWWWPEVVSDEALELTAAIVASKESTT